MGLEPHGRLSPLFEKYALRVAACQSYEKGETDLCVFTGMSLSHSTPQRLVQRQTECPPEAKQVVTEISVDGGNVRLRHPEKGEPSYWKEYKSARVENLYYGAAFQANDWLQDWLNSRARDVPR